MNLKSRIEQLEQAQGSPDACPECGTAVADHLPIAFGGLPMCGTCRTLLLPRLGDNPLQDVYRAGRKVQDANRTGD
jgi:hypothetical protein